MKLVELEPRWIDEGYNVAACREGALWTITSRDFETMSVRPSIDASKSGCWHGHIKGGLIT